MRHCLTWAVVAFMFVPVFAAEVPRPAPDFSFPQPDGKIVRVQDYRGKVVVVEVLSVVLRLCQRSSRIIEKVYLEYGPKGFQPLGVAVNVEAKAYSVGYVRDLRITYPFGYLLDRPKVNAFLQHSMMVPWKLPYLVVIDKKGIIREQYQGTDDFFKKEEENLRKLLDRLLAE